MAVAGLNSSTIPPFDVNAEQISIAQEWDWWTGHFKIDVAAAGITKDVYLINPRAVSKEEDDAPHLQVNKLQAGHQVGDNKFVTDVKIQATLLVNVDTPKGGRDLWSMSHDWSFRQNV